MRIAIVLAAALTLGAAPLTWPAQWTQFRLRNDNNVVLPGTLTATWHIATNGGFSSSPTIANGTLYIGNNGGELLAIDPASGKVKWRTKVSNPLMSAPIVYDKLVVVGEGNENSPGNASPSHPIRVGDPPNALLAFNAQNGALVWHVPLRGTGMPTPAIVDGRLVHHNGSGSVFAVDPASGRIVYTQNIHSIASMSAAVPIGRDVFVTAGVDPNALLAMRAKDGSLVWRATFSPVASGIGDCPAAADAIRVYCDYVMPPTSATPVQTERRAQFRAFAIDISSGKKAWDINLDAGVLPKRNEAAIPLLAQNTLFIGSSMANLVHAIDPATGKTKWTAATYGPVKGGIVDMQGTLYFGDLRGYLWALNASNGQLVGVKRMGTPFNVGSPIVAGQTLIIGSRGGTLWAVPLSAIRQARDIVTPPPSSSPSPGPHPRPGFRRSRPAASKEFR